MEDPLSYECMVEVLSMKEAEESYEVIVECDSSFLNA